MVRITKEEKDIICKRFPKVHIVRTVKQRSKRHTYYCEESRGVISLLNQLRKNGSYNLGGEDNYAIRKKAERNRARLS